MAVIEPGGSRKAPLAIPRAQALAVCRQNQAVCATLPHDPKGATLGLVDWFVEELFILYWSEEDKKDEAQTCGESESM